MTMKDIINSYLKELFSHICAQLREQDPIYNQSRKKIGKTDDSLQTRVHQPNPNFCKQIEDYVAAVDSLAGKEIKSAYLHGAADFF